MTNLRGQAAPWGPLASQAVRREASKRPAHSRQGGMQCPPAPSRLGPGCDEPPWGEEQVKGSRTQWEEKADRAYTFSQGLWTTHRPGPISTFRALGVDPGQECEALLRHGRARSCQCSSTASVSSPAEWGQHRVPLSKLSRTKWGSM